MDNVNYAPPMLRELVRSGAFSGDPFVLIDVGCGLGIDPVWRLFEPHLRVHAFDPQIAEIQRLAAAETNAHVRYHAGFVGLPEDDPFLERRMAESVGDDYFNPWSRLSTAAAIASAESAGPTDLEETNDWALRDLESRKIVLADFLREHGVSTIDFVKSDTDGGDLEVLRSLEDTIEPSRTLGFMVETPYTGSGSETTHTFHNVDRFLRRQGFQLATLSVNRYSRAALPAPFVHSILAQTTWGQAMWGDVVYLRDGVHPGAERYGGLTATKLLKLACLNEVFRMPDVAAEILVERRDILASLVDVDRLLDLLTPPLGGTRVGYQAYLAAFESDPTLFYPGRVGGPPASPRGVDRSFFERLRARAARAIRR